MSEILHKAEVNLQKAEVKVSVPSEILQKAEDKVSVVLDSIQEAEVKFV